MKLKEKKIEIGLVAVLILLIAPYVISILYALPSTDDFWMGIGVERSSIIVDSFQKACNMWMGWGGMWIYEFFRTLLNPVVLFGASSKLAGVELLVFFCGFIAAGWVLNRTFWKCFIGQEKLTYPLATYFLMLAWFLNTELWTEVFYWFCGSAYMWAMSLIMITVALELIYFTKPTKKVTIWLSVVGALACSFYSQAVFPCIIFLLLMAREILNTQKINWSRVVPFGCFLLGALSAMIAPGNFTRKELVESVEWSILDTLKDTAIMWKTSLLELLKNPITVVVMVVFVAIGMIGLSRSKYKYAYPLLPFTISLICLFVTYFPFALGYSRSDYLPNRAIFVYNMFAIFLLTGSCMYFGGWLRYKQEILLTRNSIMCGTLMLFLFAYVWYVPTESYWNVPYLQTVSLMDEMESANTQWRDILEEIETAKGKKVYVEHNYINTPIIKAPGVTHDVEDPNNKKFAAYYGKETVQLIWK